MSSTLTRDEKRASKNLSVTAKCLGIVLAEKGGRIKSSGSDKRSQEGTDSHNGKELLEDFKLRNKTCYWNPGLVESIKRLEYKGFVEPATILVAGNDVHLENLRSAWCRRVLKAPVGFTIERIGDVNGIEMQVIPQTQFIPLPDALCLIIMELNNSRVVATFDTLKEKLREWYQKMTMPGDQLIFGILGNLIQERKVFHSGSGYFVVTPDTYRLPSDDPNMSFNASWMPYRPMYIPVFPQIQSVEQQIQHLQHLQPYHQQLQQQQFHHAQMRSISCQANMHDKAKNLEHRKSCGSGENHRTAVKPRSHSLRRPKNKKTEQEDTRTAVSDSEEPTTQPVYAKFKSEKGKDIKDVNLKSSNINKEKEKGEKGKTSIFSKIFGRNKKKSVPAPAPPAPAPAAKEVEYATFSAQFPPPEWNWYQQQVDKHRRTENWVTQQMGKSCKAVVDGAATLRHQNEVSVANYNRGNHVLQENRNCNRKNQRNGTKPREKSHSSKHIRKKQQMLYVTTNNDENMLSELLSPVTVDDENYGWVIGNRGMDPKHSTPRYYDTIPARRDSRDSHNHHQGHRHHRSRRSHRNSVYSDTYHNGDISYEYKGRIPVKYSVHNQSQDSGVNCIGMPNNKQPEVCVDPVPTWDRVMVKNQLHSLEEEGPGHKDSNLNSTVQSEFHPAPPTSLVNNSFDDSSLMVDPGRIHMVCEAEINHRQIPQIILDSEVKVSNSPRESCDALNSEYSYETIVAAKQPQSASQSTGNSNSEAANDMSLVDSGFSSPRNAENVGTDSQKQSKCVNDGSDVRSQNTRQFLKSQPQVPHNSPQEKYQHHEDNHRYSNSHVQNNHRNSEIRNSLGDHGTNSAKELQFFQQNETSKRFGLNGEYEVVGVV